MNQDRLHFLDSSRGLAALIVFISHFILFFYPGLNSTWLAFTPLHILWDGSTAVIYFFIHSGFILTYRLQQRNFNLSFTSYLAFVWRRIFRIYPVFLITLSAMFLMYRSGYFSFNPTGPASAPLNQYWKFESGIFDFLKQALLVIRIPNDPVLRLLPQDWSLSIEIAVSLLLPVFFVLHSKNSVMLLCFIYIAVQLLSLDRFVFDFALGISIVKFYPYFRAWWQNQKTLPAKLIVFISAVVLSTTSHFLNPSISKILDLILIHTNAWGCALFLLMLLASTRIQKILNIRLLVLQGKSSYSIYLVHLSLLFLCYPISISNLMTLPVLGILVYLLVFIISILLYFGIELPAIRLGSKWEQKFFKN